MKTARELRLEPVLQSWIQLHLDSITSPKEKPRAATLTSCHHPLHPRIKAENDTTSDLAGVPYRPVCQRHLPRGGRGRGFKPILQKAGVKQAGATAPHMAKISDGD